MTFPTSADLIAIAREGQARTLARHRYRRPPGECRYCDQHRYDQMMPPHTASAGCESGKREHCTCSACF